MLLDGSVYIYTDYCTPIAEILNPNLRREEYIYILKSTRDMVMGGTLGLVR